MVVCLYGNKACTYRHGLAAVESLDCILGFCMVAIFDEGTAWNTHKHSFVNSWDHVTIIFAPCPAVSMSWLPDWGIVGKTKWWDGMRPKDRCTVTHQSKIVSVKLSLSKSCNCDNTLQWHWVPDTQQQTKEQTITLNGIYTVNLQVMLAVMQRPIAKTTEQQNMHPNAQH